MVDTACYPFNGNKNSIGAVFQTKQEGILVCAGKKSDDKGHENCFHNDEDQDAVVFRDV